MSKSVTGSSRTKDAAFEDFSDAVAALRRGDVIVFPTETLYGLGADALNAGAVEKVFELKGRDPGKPLPLIVADRAMLDTMVSDVPSAAEALIESFWPGPLTLVLPAKTGLSPRLVNAAGGLAVRVSNEPVARQLVAALLRPITATSANPAGKNPATTIEEARGYFGDRLDVFIDAGLRRSATGSTVVDLAGGGVRILREGEISASELKRVLGSGTVLR